MNDRNFNNLSIAGQFLLITTAGLTSSLVVWYLQQRLSTAAYALSTFINPEAVAEIAASFPEGEDEFTLAAWDYVGAGILYSGYGSVLTFYDTTVQCQRCLLSEQAISTGVANCVGKSVLLTSILRNRYPADRVYMVVGVYHRDGEPSGHAWVEVNRSGTWYIIESTSPPPAMPWVPAEAVSKIYSQDVFLNDMGFLCYDPEYCPTQVAVKKMVIKKRPCCTCHL